MIQIECYSEKGLVVKGITPEQAEAIRAKIGKAATQPQRGGWIYSRRHEQTIREAIAALVDPMPGPWTNDAGKLIG